MVAQLKNIFYKNIVSFIRVLIHFNSFLDSFNELLFKDFNWQSVNSSFIKKGGPVLRADLILISTNELVGMWSIDVTVFM